MKHFLKKIEPKIHEYLREQLNKKKKRIDGFYFQEQEKTNKKKIIECGMLLRLLKKTNTTQNQM